jgi:hypothetical protein
LRHLELKQNGLETLDSRVVGAPPNDACVVVTHTVIVTGIALDLALVVQAGILTVTGILTYLAKVVSARPHAIARFALDLALVVRAGILLVTGFLTYLAKVVSARKYAIARLIFDFSFIAITGKISVAALVSDLALVTRNNLSVDGCTRTRTHGTRLSAGFITDFSLVRQTRRGTGARIFPDHRRIIRAGPATGARLLFDDLAISDTGLRSGTRAGLDNTCVGLTGSSSRTCTGPNLSRSGHCILHRPHRQDRSHADCAHENQITPFRLHRIFLNSNRPSRTPLYMWRIFSTRSLEQA